MTNMLRLKGKTALVTGGSRGIGKATCLRLADEGAFVLVHYNQNKTEAESTLKRITQEGGAGALIKSNFLADNGLELFFQQADAHLRETTSGKIDILVNNAGIGCIQTIEDMTEKQFDELFTINVKAPFFVTQHALSRLADGGRVINISSLVTRMASPAVGAYSMTKGAVNTMTLWLAKQLGPRKITVNSVAPGVINTQMNEYYLNNVQSRQYMESLSTFGRVGEPNDVADVIAFLASDESRWISGQCIEVSGGSFLG